MAERRGRRLDGGEPGGSAKKAARTAGNKTNAASEFVFTGLQEFTDCITEIIDKPDGAADVVFRVADRRLGGLRALLSRRCAVFDRMLNGDFKEARKPGDEVAMEQFTNADAFRAFLIYMHSGRVVVDMLPIDLHEIANFFGMEELKKACEEHIIQAEIPPNKALAVLRYAEVNNMEALRSKIAHDIIEHQAADVFEDAVASVPQASHAFFVQMYQSDIICISETRLFRLLLEMSSQERKALLPFVRLVLLPHADIVKIVAPSNLVDSSVLIQVLAYKGDPIGVEKPSNQNLMPRMPSIPPVVGEARTFPVYTSPGGEPVVVTCGAGNLVGDLKKLCCAKFGMIPGRVQMWDYFQKTRHANLEEKLSVKIDSNRLILTSGNPILLVDQGAGAAG